MGSVTEVSTETLIERALAGDREACAAIYEALAPRMRRFLLGLRLPLSPQDVSDAMQEAFLRLFRGLPRFDKSRALLPYALGIARFVAIDLIRRAPHAMHLARTRAGELDFFAAGERREQHAVFDQQQIAHRAAGQVVGHVQPDRLARARRRGSA